jgi:electron transfer flavoprotein-quinone oxidoreductase
LYAGSLWSRGYSLSDDKFDVIVVGAGPAGSAAAIKLAQQGLSVVLIERGETPGSKNLSGGVLYGRCLDSLLPGFVEKAPIERFIINHITTFLTGDAWFGLDFKAGAFGAPPYNGYTVLRARFDRWLAEQAEAAGAMIIAGIRVDQLVKEDGRIVGVVAGDDTLLADVVIAADGANSFLAQQAGLLGRIEKKHIAVGVKALVGLPQSVIEDRFHLSGNEGAAYALVGEVTHGVAGGGFLYPNRESLSVGVVVRLDDLARSGRESAQLIEDFLQHPLITPLVKDGTLLEYGAHLVPEGGLEMTPQLGMPGLLVVGDAAGFAINSALVVRGMDLAIGSGIAAAQAVLTAKPKGDFGAELLNAYRQLLDDSFVMKDLRTYAKAPAFLETERLYTQYPLLLTDLMQRIFLANGAPKEHATSSVFKALKASGLSLWSLAGDGLKGARAL